MSNYDIFGGISEEAMNSDQCSKCGALAPVVQGDYQLGGVGIPVLIKNIELVKCAECGNIDPIIPNLDDLMNTIALAVVCSPCKLNGRDIRFLRKFSGKSSAEFARLLHVHHTHLSKMENDQACTGPQTDKLVRFLVISLNKELRNKATQLLDMLPQINDSCQNPRSGVQVDHATMKYEFA